MISIHVKYIYFIIYKTALFHTPPGTVILHAPSSVKYLYLLRIAYPSKHHDQFRTTLRAVTFFSKNKQHEQSKPMKAKKTGVCSKETIIAYQK